MSSPESEPLRFLVDENLPFAIAERLARDGHDVVDVAASAMRGATDGMIWELAVRDARVLVTRDLDFPLPLSLGTPPGIVLIRPRDGARVAEIAALFDAFLGAVNVATTTDSITVVEPGRARQRPLASLPKRR